MNNDIDLKPAPSFVGSLLPHDFPDLAPMPGRSPSPDGRGMAVDDVEVSIVMPCLNEADSIGDCVQRAHAVLKANDLRGEVIVSDNGSTDGSVEIALAAGARVVHQPLRGYGNAYLKGFAEARGRYILMADSDNSYDFGDLPRFLTLLREGYDVVMGNRFTGKILPGAMPWHHRYIGNPLLSGTLNLFFNTGVGDAHCGMRAFRREVYPRMHLQTAGMEFASEMVINAAKARLRMTEVPITYYPREGESKLSSFRDGWRHLRFMLLYSPTHLYLWPGAALMGLGVVLLLWVALRRPEADQSLPSFAWMFLGSLFAILGFQIINLGFFARVYSLSSHLSESRDGLMTFFSKHFRMESGLLGGALLFAVGALTFLVLLYSVTAGTMEVSVSIRLSILALTLSVVGAQTVFASFFVSMMVIRRLGWPK